MFETLSEFERVEDRHFIGQRRLIPFLNFASVLFLVAV